MLAVKIIWCNSLNVGDTITPYIALRENCMPILSEDENDKEPKILGCGSILNWNRENTYVWGAGIATRTTFSLKPYITVGAVRGPISEEMLVKSGYKGPKVKFGDPGLLLPDYYCPYHPKRFKLGIIPHYMDIEMACSLFGSFVEHGEIKILNVWSPIENFIDDLLRCDVVISSSLHGLILADAYNIPSMRVVFTDKINGDGTKYQDYFESVKRTDEPVKIDQSTLRGVDVVKLIKSVPALSKSRMGTIDGLRDSLRATNPFRNLRQQP